MAELSVTLYTSSFCGACTAARATAARAAELLGDRVEWREVNVADAPAESERAAITATRTVVIRASAPGAAAAEAAPVSDAPELFRASGAPTVPQLLTAIAGALPA